MPAATPPKRPLRDVVVDLGPRVTQVERVRSDGASQPPRRPKLELCIDRFRSAEGLTGDSSPAAQLYRTGLAAERTDELITASSAYSRLIEQHPESPFFPLALLGMASMLKTARQPRLAANKYGQLLFRLSPSHPVHRYARYRRGMLELKGKDFAAAMGDLKAAIIGTPSEPCEHEIVLAARHAFVTCYVAAGKPELAHDALKPLSGDIGKGHAHTVDLLVTLASGYLTDKQPGEAAIVLNDTLQRYQPLRRQCANIATLVDHLYDPQFPTIASLAALEAQAADRCDDGGG